MALDTIAVLNTTEAALYSSAPKSLQANPPGAATDFFATAYTVPSWCNRITVTISTSVSSVFAMRVKAAGGSVAATSSLNGGSALAAACLYAFDIPVVQGSTINFQLATNGTLSTFKVEASPGVGS